MEKNTHPIKLWLKREGHTSQWLAAQAGITKGHLSRIVNGGAVPSKPLALALQSVTGGGVLASQWWPE